VAEEVVPRTPANITQADIARAIRAMRGAGYPDVRVVFKDGAIIVEAKPEDASGRRDAGLSSKPERVINL
jgi:hypothetical protein